MCPLQQLAVGGVVSFSLLMSLGCKDLTGDQQLPSGTLDPATFETPAGALGMRNAALVAFEQALPTFIVDGGLLTDELEANTVGASLGVLSVSGDPSALSESTQLDERILRELHGSEAQRLIQSGGSGTYGALQMVRRNARQALGALVVYNSSAPSAVRGELYALTGYAEIMLADLFCSGVPLSTLDFQKDFTYKAGSTTSQIYQDALVQFDSALALSTDSVRLMDLAYVGRARALLALGQYENAAHAVATVLDGFVYQLPIQWTDSASGANLLTRAATVADGDGGIGFPYVSSNDPRTQVHIIDTSQYNAPLYFPTRYNSTGLTFFPVATAIEARLIEAEAALQASDPRWLLILNALRTDGSFTTAPHPGSPQVIDTTWNAGTGGVGGLKPLHDPGNDSARVVLLFNERAAWLFLTGHRQGDLRRLIRNYGRPQDVVYPTGTYLKPGLSVYGTDVTAPVPGTEDPDPLFTGCFNRDA